MLYGEKISKCSVNVGLALIKESTKKKFLGITCDKRLPFETHTQQLCIMSSQKTAHVCMTIPFYGLKKACNSNECIHSI